MKKSKKLIIGAMMAAVLLIGSVVGVAMADDDNGAIQTPVGIQERLAEKLGITVEELQSAMDEIRGELPQRNCDGLQCERGPAGCFGSAFAELDEETRAALKADLAQAREDMQAEVAEIFASYGIDVDEMRAECAGNACNRLAFQRGFMVGRGMGGRGCMGELPAPVE